MRLYLAICLFATLAACAQLAYTPDDECITDSCVGCIDDCAGVDIDDIPPND